MSTPQRETLAERIAKITGRGLIQEMSSTTTKTTEPEEPKQAPKKEVGKPHPKGFLGPADLLAYKDNPSYDPFAKPQDEAPEPEDFEDEPEEAPKQDPKPNNKSSRTSAKAGGSAARRKPENQTDWTPDLGPSL